MAQAISCGAPAPVLAVINGIPTTTSLDVARYFGKRHGHVLRAIHDLIDQLPPERQPNFGLTFLDVTGPNGATRSEPGYRLTRDGFTLLAMGFTGARALEFKLAYLDAFNRLEAEVARRPLPSPATILDIDVGAARLALTGAAQLGAEVQAEALGRLSSDGWLEGGRWLLSFVPDDYRPGQCRPRVERLEPGTFITTLRRLADNMSDPASMHQADELAYLARACLAELERRAAYARQLEIAAAKARRTDVPVSGSGVPGSGVGH